MLTQNVTKIINNSLNNFYDNSLNNTFKSNKQLLVTRQAKSLRNLVVRAQFGLWHYQELSDFKNLKTGGVFLQCAISILALVRN